MEVRPRYTIFKTQHKQEVTFSHFLFKVNIVVCRQVVELDLKSLRGKHPSANDIKHAFVIDDSIKNYFSYKAPLLLVIGLTGPFVNPQKVKSNIQNELAQLKAKTKLGKLVGHIKKLNASGAAPDSPDVLAANDAFTKMAAMFEKSVGNTVSTSVTRLLKEADPAIDTSTWKAPLAPKEFNTFIETLPTAEIPAELQSIIGNDLRETMTAVVDTSESVSGVLPQSSTKETDGNEESSTSSDDGVPEEVGKKKKKTTNRMIRKLRKISDNTSLLERISGLECKEIFTSFEDFMKLPTCKLSKEDRKNWLENAAKKLKDKYDTWMWSKHCCSMFLDPAKRNERDYSMIVEFVDSSLDKDLIDEIVEKIKTHCTESSSTALIVSIPLTLMFLMLLLL